MPHSVTHSTAVASYFLFHFFTFQRKDLEYIFSSQQGVAGSSISDHNSLETTLCFNTVDHPLVEGPSNASGGTSVVFDGL